MYGDVSHLRVLKGSCPSSGEHPNRHGHSTNSSNKDDRTKPSRHVRERSTGRAPFFIQDNTMNEQRDANRLLWDELTATIALRREMKRYQERVTQMVLGNEPRSQMIIAPHGCGKGYALEQAILAAGKKPFIFDKTTPNAMPMMLEECSKPGFVGVIDDKDSLLQDLRCMEHISTATGSKEDAFARQGNAFTLQRREDFCYDVVLGICANIDPRDPAVVGKKVADFWKKLERRLQIKKVEATEEERYLYTCYQIICEGALRRSGHSAEAVNEYLEFLCLNRHCIEDPSLGGAKNALSARSLYSDWRSHVVGPQLRDRPEIGPTPRIVAADRVKGKTLHVVKAPRNRTSRDVLYELSDKIWKLPDDLSRSPRQLGYIAGLFEQLRNISYSSEFEDAVRTARASVVYDLADFAPEPVAELGSVEASPAAPVRATAISEPKPSLAVPAAANLWLREVGGKAIDLSRQTVIIDQVRNSWKQMGSPPIDSIEGRKLIKAISLKGRTDMGLACLGARTIERILLAA